MTPDEIRQYANQVKAEMKALSSIEAMTVAISAGHLEMFIEIAAQLAELNQNIKLLPPSKEEIQHRAVELDMEEEEQIREQRRRSTEVLHRPTRDPERFTRCSSCLKEVSRPEWCEVGQLITCDDCIPF